MRKISIKREQSQAGLSFAERKKFRPQVKNKLLLLLALLLTAATGAWAQEPATTYSVKMKAGTVDAKNWSIASGEKSATGDAADGLTGLSEGDAVTLTYTGRRKVKGVKATSDAAAASVPDGALSGVFSVSATKKVYFSKGNLRYASSKWSFFDNQYDFYTGYSEDAWDHFGWSTSATTYGMSTSTSNSTYSGDFVDWGSNSDLQTALGTGWFTLSSAEWTYLFNTRSASTVGGTENGRYAKAKVNDVPGVIIFPDTYTHPDGVTAPTGVNATDETGWNGNTYSSADWAKMESAGCVFLPAAGIRTGSSLSNPGTRGTYWSSSPNGTDEAYRVYFTSGGVTPANRSTRSSGCSVRLVREVATSDDAAKEPATVTTAPTGAAVVGVGKSTALVSGGEAEGGTLMYAWTTVNTKPTSTDGFSATVPTAETITASGTVYVWYYVKGDDTHSDSEIAATAIEIPVADIVWDATNVSDLIAYDTYMSYDKEGITLSANAQNIQAQWADYGDPATLGIVFQANESGGFTFTAPTGKAFTKIEMKPQDPSGWDEENLGDGWAYFGDDDNEIFTVTWKGSAAASTVDLLTGAGFFVGAPVKRIAFYLSE